MQENDIKRICSVLEQAIIPCREIHDALIEHLKINTEKMYEIDIQADIVVINNLIRIISTSRDCISNGHICASTELLLGICANDYSKRLLTIPYKRILHDKIIRSLKDIHLEVHAYFRLHNI